MASPPAKHILGQLNHLLQAGEAADDGQLLERFVRQRDEDAFARLMARHGGLVFGVCRRVLGDRHAAEDVFQATFLVLARRAGGIRKPGSLASFLHGVAYRLAIKARGETERRRERERRLPPPVESEEPDLSWREVRTLIDEELQRLPERLRLPLVLCYLEGQTQDEAARRLGWPRGTLKRRLERGRELLRRRLSRRGVTLGSGLFVSALAVDTAPAALRNVAVRAALAFRGGELTTPAALLARAALPSTSALRLKSLGVFVLVLGCAAAAAGLTARQAAAPPQADTKPPPEVKRVRVDRYGDALPEGAKLRLGTVRLRQGQPTYDAVFTPDGKTAIVGDGGGGIVFWDVATAREVRRLQHAQNVISALAITPDGKKLAAGQGQIVDLWDIASGKMLQHKVTNKGTISKLLFTPDGKTLAIADGTPTITVWDIANNKQRHELKGHKGDVACIAISPDGKTLASGSWRDGHIRLWDLASGKEKFRFVAHEKDVYSVAFSPDGKTLVSGGNAADHLFTPRPPSFRFWDAATGAKIREIPDHYPLAFAYFPDGKTIAGIESNRKLQTYDVQTGKVLREYDAPPRIMTKVVISPDGKVLATLWGAANTFDLWDATRGRLLHSFEGHQGGVGALAFAADDQTLFSADGTTDRCLLTAWNTTTGALRGRFGTQSDRGHALALSPDGKRLAIGSADSLKLWDPATQKEVRSYNPYWFGRGAGRPVLSVSWSADGKRLASRTAPDMIIRVWDVAADRQLRAIETGTNWPSEIALSPDGSVVATGGEPNQGIRRWSVADGKELPPLVASQGRVQTLAFSPDGSTLASGEEQGHIHLWNAATGRLQRGWNTKTGFLRLAFSRDGRTLATGHEDNTVRLWEVATGAERACFVGHRGPAASVAFSHDGRTLASGSGDTTILLWDATCGARPGAELTIEQLRALWDDLIGTDAGRAYRAMWQLAVSPRASLPFLAERLRPAAPLDAAQQKQVERLLADLDDEAFAVRQKAETELEKMGDAIEPALRKRPRKQTAPGSTAADREAAGENHGHVRRAAADAARAGGARTDEHAGSAALLAF